MYLKFVIGFLLVNVCVCMRHGYKPPLFKNGRPRRGFLGSPKINRNENFKSAEAQWFTQKLNHFDDSDDRTWKQKYYVNASSFGMNGPVFLMIGGEGPLSANWVGVGTMVEYAVKYKALVIALEHRYYGDSHPLSDLSTPNLKYLSSEQALADLATFREAMVKQFSLTYKNRWIAFGGSYPGALSAWFRAKYPHLVFGSVASSAPINAQLDFPQYLEVSTESLSNDLCRTNVAQATRMLTNYTATEPGLKYLSQRFKTCKPLTSNTLDIANFAEGVSGNFFGVIQYNKDNREFEGATGTNITISTLCGIMNNKELGDPLERYAAINDMIMKTYERECLDVSYNDFIEFMKNVNLNASSSEGGRQWLYQTCTEFGYYQTTDSQDQVFGSLSPLSFSLKQCVDIFGDYFNQTSIQRGIDWTNANYGSYGLSATRIIFPNGSIDPWHALSFTKSVRDLVAIFIQGTAHCANMYPSGPNDSEDLIEAKQKIDAIIGEWLASPEIY